MWATEGLCVYVCMSAHTWAAEGLYGPICIMAQEGLYEPQKAYVPEGYMGTRSIWAHIWGPEGLIWAPEGLYAWAIYGPSM